MIILINSMLTRFVIPAVLNLIRYIMNNGYLYLFTIFCFFFQSFELTIILTNSMYAVCYTSGSQLNSVRYEYLYLFIIFHFFRGFELMIILISFIHKACYTSGSQLNSVYYQWILIFVRFRIKLFIYFTTIISIILL